MDEQDGYGKYIDNDPVDERDSGEYSSDFRPGFRREDYSDAHYEPADETTVPPRYYTPPERSSRDPRPRRKNKTDSHKTAVIFAVVVAAILGGLCGAAWTEGRLNSRFTALENSLSEYNAALEDTRDAVLSIQSSTLQSSDLSVPSDMNPSEIYDQAKQQVVGIRTEVTVTNFFGMTSSGAVSGSGFIISEDGYILTNYHVVEDAYNGRFDIEVMTYDGTKYNASIVGVEAANDLAVLKIDAEGLTPAQFGDSDGLRVGDVIYAIGNPLGELEFSMSTGHVSALDRVINTQENESINMFQIDAAVNEGNSGGPVYDTNGKVIGIVTAKYSSSGVEGLGFAIPINDAKGIADDLINKGYVTGKAYMGVNINSRYNSMYAQYYGMPLGAFVGDEYGNSGVTPGSAAERAGLKDGDIITAIGDYTIHNYDDLKLALRHFSAFDTTQLTVYRSGEEIQLTITFDEARPENY